MERSLLLVHAHPDDESIGTGATMAKYAAEGARVTLVACTLGELGEIIPPDLRHLFPDELGQHRIVELDRACAALGVADHRFLGGEGWYRDSGMMGLPTNEHSRAFWGADVDEAAGLLLEIIREIRPQVLVTYDENGFYGHPDHIQAHRVAMRAVELAEPEGLAPAKVYWAATPRSQIEQGFEAFKDSADNPFEGVKTPSEIPFGTPDELIAACIDGRSYAGRKLAALHAHATQIPPKSWLFVMAGRFGDEALGTEHFQLVRGERGAGDGPNGWESDLFAGLTGA